MEAFLSIERCPACARDLQLSHEAVTTVQCACGTALQRSEGRFVEKPFYIIQQAAAVIQPGTAGVWNGKPFRVLGRFRAWIEEFVYNYWTIAFEDGLIGSLGEGYGLYAVYEKTETGDIRNALAGAKTGAQREIRKGDFFLLERKYTCHKWEIEGEVWMPETLPTFRTFEFAAPDGRHVEAWDFEKVIAVFNVSYTSAASLRLTNTRSGEPHKKELRCKQCSRDNTIKTAPYAQSYACRQCGARHALHQDGSFKLQQGGNGTDDGPAITLGASALVKGIAYEVIGYAVKEESNVGRSQWREYTLFNPQEGFAFLSEYNGNWVYVRERGDAPVLERHDLTEFTYDAEPFQLFNRYKYETINAAGEFPYNLFNDGDKDVREFISPPEIWIQEKSNREGIIWFGGEHISRSELQAAFGEALIMPSKRGVGAVEPKGYVTPYKIAVVAFFGVLLLLFAHLVTTLGLQKRVISNRRYAFDSVSTVSAVTGKFVLDKWRSNLQLDIDAPVDNSWFELNATLVNAVTGAEYSVEQGVEYYHGYSDGESWTEGSPSETAYLSQIPAGTYYLQISGTRESSYGGYALSSFRTPEGFYLTVTYDTANDRNLVVCLAILLIMAFVQHQIVQYHERSRWSDSPFAPEET